MIGETISHYRVLAKLGAGGMGDVYLAEDTALKRKVALKFLQADINVLGHAKQRFLREARAAATLHHPNIVHVYEVGEADGKPFIAMEYIDGETLDRRIDRRPLDVREILRIGTEIADALAEWATARLRSVGLKKLTQSVLAGWYGLGSILEWIRFVRTRGSRLFDNGSNRIRYAPA